MFTECVGHVTIVARLNSQFHNFVNLYPTHKIWILLLRQRNRHMTFWKNINARFFSFCILKFVLIWNYICVQKQKLALKTDDSDMQGLRHFNFTGSRLLSAEPKNIIRFLFLNQIFFNLKWPQHLPIISYIITHKIIMIIQYLLFYFS